MICPQHPHHQPTQRRCEGERKRRGRRGRRGLELRKKSDLCESTMDRERERERESYCSVVVCLWMKL